MKGLSITIVFGKYAKPHVGFARKKSDITIFRLCLGWFAITIHKSDIEELIVYLINENKKLKSATQNET